MVSRAMFLFGGLYHFLYAPQDKAVWLLQRKDLLMEGKEIPTPDRYLIASLPSLRMEDGANRLVLQDGPA